MNDFMQISRRFEGGTFYSPSPHFFVLLFFLFPHSLSQTFISLDIRVSIARETYCVFLRSVAVSLVLDGVSLIPEITELGHSRGELMSR